MKREIVKASIVPPMLFYFKNPKKLRIVDTIIFEFPIKKLKTGVDVIDTWGIDHSSLDYTIFMSMLVKDIKKHKDFKDIKLKKNQFLTLIGIRTYRDLNIAEVECDIVEEV